MSVDPTPLFEALEWLIRLGDALAVLPVQVILLYQLPEAFARLGEALGELFLTVFITVLLVVAGIGAVIFILFTAVAAYYLWRSPPQKPPEAGDLAMPASEAIGWRPD
jgi:hypothetical protein